MTQMHTRQVSMPTAVHESNGFTLTNISRMHQEGHRQARLDDRSYPKADIRLLD